jgi:hypothetical protein
MVLRNSSQVLHVALHSWYLTETLLHSLQREKCAEQISHQQSAT